MAVKAVIDMNKYADLMGLRFMKKVLNVKSIDYFERYEPKDQGKIAVTKLYSLLRHPQQAGIMLLFVFAGVRFSLDRVVFIIYMIVGILIGVKQEEKQLEKQFQSYSEYKKTVQNRFIPDIRRLFSSDKNAKTE